MRLLTGPKTRCPHCTGRKCKICGGTGVIKRLTLVRNTGKDYGRRKHAHLLPDIYLTVENGEAVERPLDKRK